MKIMKKILMELEKCNNCQHEFKPRTMITKPICPQCKHAC